MSDIYLGDCLEVRSVLADNSIDTIITDPPYGLEFMGKGWDKCVPGVEFWREFLAVTKPGGMLLAFGGTRTFHRMTTAIEDAGWEIRDCMMWLYSSGFPKSHNFGCKCGEKDDKSSPESDLRPVLVSNVPQTVDIEKERREVLQSGVPEQSAPTPRPTGAESQNAGGQQSRMEGRRNVLEETRKLSTDQVCALPDSISADGAEGRLCDGTPFASGATNQETIDGNGSGTPLEPQSAGQPARKFRAASKQPKPQVSRMGTCLTCGGLRDWRGYGTALKPAWEPIIVAMKPLDGTFAQNAEKWGVAGINVDGARIAATDFAPKERVGATKLMEERPWNRDQLAGERKKIIEGNDKGRWPANLVLDEDAAAMLDGQSGISASRFFYCAKASKGERNEGCEETMTWEGQGQNLLMESIKLHAKDISGDILSLMVDRQWSIELSGSELTVLSQPVLISITLTILKLITELKTSCSSQNSNISAFIRDALKGLAESGISLAAIVEQFEKLKNGTTSGRTGSALGASLAVLQMLSEIKNSAKLGNVHSTVKPLKLMEYLCTLTKTPTGGVVLDPFAGSGTTLLAAKNTGREYVGIEQNPKYFKIIEARLGLI